MSFVKCTVTQLLLFTSLYLSCFGHVSSSCPRLALCFVLGLQLSFWTAAVGMINKTLPSWPQLWGCSIQRSMCQGRDTWLSLYVYVIQYHTFSKTWDMSGINRGALERKDRTWTLPAYWGHDPQPSPGASLSFSCLINTIYWKSFRIWLHHLKSTCQQVDIHRGIMHATEITNIGS